MAMAIGESKADRLEAERNNYEYLITKKGISNEERTAAYNTYIELSQRGKVKVSTSGNRFKK